MADGAIVVARFNSTRKPGNIYEVKREQDGTLWCACVGWKFSKEKPKVCRHTRIVLQGDFEDDSEVIAMLPRWMATVDALVASRWFINSGWVESVKKELTMPQPLKPGRILSGDAVKSLAQNVRDLVTALEASGVFAPQAQPAQARAVGSVSQRRVRLITLED